MIPHEALFFVAGQLTALLVLLVAREIAKYTGGR